MISSDDQSGVFTFLVGIIVLVMAGVALSLLVDKRFRFSSSKAALESAIRADSGELSGLEAVLYDLRARLEAEGPARTRNAAKHAELRARSGGLDKRQKELVVQRDTISREVAALDEAFGGYRERYRQAEWSRAVGEELGTLTVRGGREYRHAVISKVTDAGLEIRHEHGMARVQAPDLDPALRERFQWDDARRARLLAEERSHHDAVSRQVPEAEDARTGKAPPRRVLPASTSDEEAIVKARTDVRQWRAKVSQLKSDHRAALSNSSSGSTSVPGSLETWSARASRLGAELARSRAALAAAREKLGQLAPGDPLLRTDREND